MNGGEGGEQWWLTRVLLEDPLILDQAAALAAAHGPGDGTRLAVRQLLDARIRKITRWPRDEDYARIAADLEHAGLGDKAGVLRQVADGELQDQARDRWMLRYAYRPEAERDIRADPRADDGIDWSDDADVRGTDGAWYQHGYAGYGGRRWFIVAVHGRGFGEHVMFTSYEQQRRWLADRGPTATGELVIPDVSPVPRVVLEEKILAGMLADPNMFTQAAMSLPPGSFTADARYEIYGAILSLAGDGRRWYPGEVVIQLGRRAAWLPERALRDAGGYGVPWTQAYLRRLMDTPVSRADADAAAVAVADEDTAAAEANGWYHAVADPVAGLAASAGGELPETALWRQQRAAQIAEHGTAGSVTGEGSPGSQTPRAALRPREFTAPDAGNQWSLPVRRPVPPGPDDPVPRL
ncbi:MAG TPA: hypothetical protein VFB06_02765 [Streptosporangiaceae bacterium]|nr:hypothetical protein [Streptosporangiaceae bacterium]